MSSVAALVMWIALCAGGGAIVGILTGGGESAWYLGLRTPTWNPPSAVFAPVWTALYTMMAIAAWRVWRHGGWRVRRGPLTLFLCQLAVNWAWSFLFFTWQSPLLALVDIVIMWVLIAATWRVFARVDMPAAWLLVPYLAWVTFATFLNGAIVAMN